MPQIQLPVDDDGEVALLAPGIGTVSLARRRVRAWVYLGDEHWTRLAVIDTGAPACILPSRVWTLLEKRDQIEWITQHPARFAGSGEMAETTVFGGSYRYRLGRVQLKFVDLGSGELAPRDVLAICIYDPQTDPPHLQLPVVIGLADVMNGRTLQLEASADGQRWAATLSEP